MKIGRLLSVLVLFIFGLTAVAQEQFTMDYGDYERGYFLYVPESYGEATPTSLVIALHGAGGSGLDMVLGSRFNEQADESGTIMVYPNGIRQGWDYLDRSQLHPAERDSFVDDLGFIPALIEAIQADYNIDAERIFVAGYSNGGMMALRLACEMPDVFAGAAILSANFSFRLVEHCNQNPTTSVAFILGTRDSAFPWQGTAYVREDGYYRGQLSIAQTIGLMTTVNRCETTSGVTTVTGEGSPIDVVHEGYSECSDGQAVELFALIDADHSYPVRPLITLRDGSVGRVQDVVWAFFGLD